MKAVLLLAHGAPESLDDVPAYVLRIRHGRPLEDNAMATIVERYKLIGGSPLLKWTQLQAGALQQKLSQTNSEFSRVYIGMRHSHPYIRETVEQMKSDGVEQFTAICMAPQFSKLTIGAYRKALEEALEGSAIPYTVVNSYAKHPALIHAFTIRLQEALALSPGAGVLFTAHSLPERVLAEADPYDFEVKETARLVAKNAGIPDWRFAYQSQGMTSDKWLGPTVELRLDEFASRGVNAVVIACIGFVCDHVEILYDIDILYKNYAQTKGIVLTRTASLNDSPEFIDLLSQLIQA